MIDPRLARARAVPLAIAHRGSSHDLPEHTLPAYEQAIADGADALECDVRLTADGHLVCLHDRRVDRTSDGSGTVSRMTLAQLSELDFGSWKGTGPQRLLPLEQLLDLATAAPRPVGLAIETKHPTRHSGRVETELVRLLHRFGLTAPRSTATPRMQLMSFSRTAVRRLHRLAPTLPTVHLVEHPVLLPGLPLPAPAGARIIGIDLQLIRARPDHIARLHTAGFAVHVWTVDEPQDIELCLRLGVDAIITNRPALVRAKL
ncbi:glycerophosphodiester phosphodiesterase family protein [Streptomyces sp. NPDC093097]|uniref:glycerophosphodiester phosphodiesterase family protein n=1 Tax=Streptomyces sp. NPDC093097 TaxID=3366027 RepID=UPI003812C56E